MQARFIPLGAEDLPSRMRRADKRRRRHRRRLRRSADIRRRCRGPPRDLRPPPPPLPPPRPPTRSARRGAAAAAAAHSADDGAAAIATAVGAAAEDTAAATPVPVCVDCLAAAAAPEPRQLLGSVSAAAAVGFRPSVPRRDGHGAFTAAAAGWRRRIRCPFAARRGRRLVLLVVLLPSSGRWEADEASTPPFPRASAAAARGSCGGLGTHDGGRWRRPLDEPLGRPSPPRKTRLGPLARR